MAYGVHESQDDAENALAEVSRTISSKTCH
jgi:hypothetical protein